MRHHLPLSLAVLLALGCTRENAVPPPDAPDAPPLLQGTYRDEAGVERTVVRIEGMLHYGDTAERDAPEAEVLLGYEFEASEGARPRVTLALERGDGRLAVSLHGPRDAIGLWEAVLGAAESDGATPATLQDVPITRPGYYLLLVRNRGASADARYALRLECEGEACSEPACPDRPCDLVCRDGFEVDDTACRLCECIPPACTPERCGPDAVCGDDGRCRPRERPCEADCPGEAAPVCAGGVDEYPNACVARCRGADRFEPGPCPPPRPPAECDGDASCPRGKVCRDGRCVERACECPPRREPVCGTDGHTYENECALRCRLGADGLDYRGECVRGRCTDVDDCEDDWRCVPAAWVPDNGRACREDPESPECVRVCVPPAPQRGCGPENPCPAGLVCYPPNADQGGMCLSPCRLARPESCGERVCATVRRDLAERGFGLCLPACGEREPCPDGLRCQPDLEGQAVCQAPCPCREDARNPVCTADGREFPSACHARCAGYDQVERCREAPPPACDCEPGPGYVCGADGRLYASECEATRCHGQRVQDLTSCLRGDPPRTACRGDDDCFPTGCNGRFCGSARADVCARFSLQSECLAMHGDCGCGDDGLCRFTPTEEAVACWERR